MKNLNYRLLMLPVLALFCSALMLTCADDINGTKNSAPTIDTIIANPDAIHPGADVILTARAFDADGDSLSYRWFTYRAAARFSDTASPVCTMIVSTALEGGMSLKVTLEVSDGQTTVLREKWISIVSGTLLSGHVYFYNSKIPIPLAEVSVNRLRDTTAFKGAYSIRHVPPGDRTVNASREGCDDFSTVLDVTDSMTYDVYMICPDLTNRLTGTVAIHDGTPLENIEISILQTDSSPTGFVDTTGIDGSFGIDMIPPSVFLLASRDVGNSLYDLDTDTISISLFNDTSISITSRMFSRIFSSPGIDSTHHWVFEDVDFWHSWRIDSSNECYAFNSCIDGVFGKIWLTNPVPIPVEAVKLAWEIDIDLEYADCIIYYYLDGQIVGSEDIAKIQADSPGLRHIIDLSGDPAGKNFSVALFVWVDGIGLCADVCLKRFELFMVR